MLAYRSEAVLQDTGVDVLSVVLLGGQLNDESDAHAHAGDDDSCAVDLRQCEKVVERCLHVDVRATFGLFARRVAETAIVDDEHVAEVAVEPIGDRAQIFDLMPNAVADQVSVVLATVLVQEQIGVDQRLIVGEQVEISTCKRTCE